MEAILVIGVLICVGIAIACSIIAKKKEQKRYRLVFCRVVFGRNRLDCNTMFERKLLALQNKAVSA